MEPGHEDREYRHINPEYVQAENWPQWSPVMKTGNTPPAAPQLTPPPPPRASMEPGHEDREYLRRQGLSALGGQLASMEPGHEDREYTIDRAADVLYAWGLNGARS